MAAEGSRARARVPPDGSDAIGAPPLAEAKLAAPTLRRATVDRPRITQALDAVPDAALTLVAAPAGYGKTTAVRAWCATTAAALAWVTIDVGDNDLSRLWRHVATAVDRVRPGLGRRALRRLDVAGGSVDAAVDELMNGIAVFRQPLILVLDDLHAVTSDECLASIDHALTHRPSNARLILVTRVDPDLNLAGLRAAGALVELRASDLAFTREETREMLITRGGLELGPEEIDLLVSRTEGWPAAIVLAELWLRTVSDPATAVRVFGGEHRFVADYLSSEVLAALDDDRRGLLYAGAVLGEFTADLCDSVLGRTDSARLLAELEHANLLLSRLEQSDWFRIHPLLAEYARAELAAAEPDASRRIHRRAADWFTSRGQPAEAVAHASAAGDHDFVARTLVEYHLSLVRSGGGRTFLRWFETLPEERIVEHPELPAAAAIAGILVGRNIAELRRFLALSDRANEGRAPSSDPSFATWGLIARALVLEGGVAQAVETGRRAVELAERGSDEATTGALVAYARTLYLGGRLEEAAAAATRALEHPDLDRRPPSMVLAHATLALIAAERGRLATARRHAEKAKDGVGRTGTSRSWLGAHASAALGTVLAAEGHFTEAEHEFVTAERFFDDDEPSLHHAWICVLLAGVRVQRGHVDDAESALRAARDALDELGDSGRVPALADAVEQELAGARSRADRGEVLDAPSEAELTVLQLLASDLTAREIGERLFLSPNTIRSHKRALYRKLGAHSQAEAVARATVLGLLEQTHSPT
jgi:ATP/maltotriose-dependent transcriptional regulator MalT